MSSTQHQQGSDHSGEGHEEDHQSQLDPALANEELLPAPDVSPVSVSRLSHTQLLANPLYLNLFTEQVALKAKNELLQHLLDDARPLPPSNRETSEQSNSGPLGGRAHSPTSLGLLPGHAGIDGSTSSSSHPFGTLPFTAPADHTARVHGLPPHNASFTAIPSRAGRKREDYPQIKYWTRDEAMSDPTAHKNPNVRKPTLKVVVEKLDGTPVDETRFAEIQSLVRTACSRCLDLTVSYTKQSPQAQDVYIASAEGLAPELSYCDETGWKAVMMARTFIDGKTRRGRDTMTSASGGGGGQVGPDGSPAPASMKRRGRPKRDSTNGPAGGANASSSSSSRAMGGRGASAGAADDVPVPSQDHDEDRAASGAAGGHGEDEDSDGQVDELGSASGGSKRRRGNLHGRQGGTPDEYPVPARVVQ